MKTNLVLCLALLAATGTLPAEQKGRKAAVQQSAARMAPRQATNPAAIKRVMPTPQAKPRTAGSVNRNTTIPSDSRIPGNSPALREGRNVANGFREMETLRHSGLEGLRENFGTGGTQPRGQQTPTDPLADESYTPRNPEAPAGVTRNDNGGVTDIRGSAEGSRKGTRPMSAFGRGLSTSGPRTGRVHYGSGGNNRTSTSSSGVGNGGYHNTIEHRDENGRTTGYTDTWTTADQNGTRTTTDTYNADGSFAGSETIFEHPDGRVESKSVGADGRVVVTTDDHGTVTQSEAAGSGPPPARDTSSGDRTPDGIGSGGPVGPSAAAISGLVPLDLLRQRANGETNGSGPGQYSIAGGTGADQVRPGGNTHTPGPRVRSQNTVVNPGPIDGTPGSGDDRP